MNHNSLPAVLAAGALALLAGCGSSTGTQAGSGGASASPMAHAATQNAVVQVGKTSLGRVLVDRHGMTVYLLTADTGGHSSCSASCLVYWPAVKAPAKLTAGKGVTAKLGTTKSADGTMMVTASGHPLYTFVKDKAPGDVTGQGLANFGGTWYVLSPSGKAITTMPAGSGGSGGGGY